MSRDSEMQRRFGAKINVTPPSASDRQIFFLTTDPGVSLTGLVTAQGGTSLLTGPGWLLAELSFTRAMSLRGAPGIRMIGGVSIDAQIEGVNLPPGQTCGAISWKPLASGLKPNLRAIGNASVKLTLAM